MKKDQFQLGLVVEGNTTSAAVLRLDKLGEHLGPVKSVGLGAARRLSNTLRAGSAIADYASLSEASLVFIHVPDDAVARVADEIASAPLPFQDMAFVLCESWHGVQALHPLQLQGAHTGALMPLPIDGRSWFVVEGDSRAVRHSRRVIERSGCKATELSPGGMHLLFAAQLLIRSMPIASFQAAQQGLRAGGFSGNVLTSAMELMLQKSLRDFLRVSKGRWTGPLRESSDTLSQFHLAQLAKHRPDLTEFIHAQMSAILRLTGELPS